MSEHRRVVTRHCSASRCWCASKIVRVDKPLGIVVRPDPNVYMVEDERGNIWTVSRAIIEEYTEKHTQRSRWDIIAGVED
jgi:hypothetical protein